MKEIVNNPDKETAFNAIASLEVTSRKKAILRLAWKRKHSPETIKKCPAKGKKVDATELEKEEKKTRMKKDLEQEKIEKIKKQIAALQGQLAELLQNTGGACFMCGKDPEGYDLPCKHDLCHPCFMEASKETGKIRCGICSTEHQFDFDKIIEEEEEEECSV